ncbi:hypothetical protein C8R44DRAFT_733206 [Mycena epipterygia]|nr:hypothetical protein C8R44DRAFT_733206 [Mycena epipterygia]
MFFELLKKFGRHNDRLGQSPHLYRGPREDTQDLCKILSSVLSIFSPLIRVAGGPHTIALPKRLAPNVGITYPVELFSLRLCTPRAIQVTDREKSEKGSWAQQQQCDELFFRLPRAPFRCLFLSPTSPLKKKRETLDTTKQLSWKRVESRWVDRTYLEKNLECLARLGQDLNRRNSMNARNPVIESGSGSPINTLTENATSSRGVSNNQPRLYSQHVVQKYVLEGDKCLGQDSNLRGPLSMSEGHNPTEVISNNRPRLLL